MKSTVVYDRCVADVLVIACDGGACGQHRILLPAAQLDDVVNVRELHDSMSDPSWEPEEHVVVFQRVQHQLIYDKIVQLRDKGHRVVVELDDDFEAMPEGHPSRHRLDPANNKTNNWAWIRRCVEAADELVCSTEAIRERYGKGIVVPNMIPEAYLNIKRTPESVRLRIGWPGDARHHVGDLEEAVDAVGSVCPPHTVAVVGSRNVFQILGTGLYTPFVPFQHYAATIARSFDIGIAPLAQNEFNRSKSWLKALEFAALGVPFVASRSPEYVRLGLGDLADGPGEWKEALQRLTSLHDDERMNEGEVLREGVRAAGLTYEKNASAFLHAWVG
jgi:hypothetical protein